MAPSRGVPGVLDMSGSAPARSSVAVIETRALTKRYGSTTALDGLDLSVRAGGGTVSWDPRAGQDETIGLLLGSSCDRRQRERVRPGCVGVAGADPPATRARTQQPGADLGARRSGRSCGCVCGPIAAAPSGSRYSWAGLRTSNRSPTATAIRRSPIGLRSRTRSVAIACCDCCTGPPPAVDRRRLYELARCLGRGADLRRRVGDRGCGKGAGRRGAVRPRRGVRAHGGRPWPRTGTRRAAAADRPRGGRWRPR